MTISTETTASGAIRCITEIEGRRYKGKYRNCDIKQARKKFRQLVLTAERDLMDGVRQELIDVCLNCQIPAKQCKGNCKIKQAIKIKRGKCIK